MKLPFIQQRGIGLYFTKESIQWVDLARVGNTLKICGFDEEKLNGNDVKDTLSRLISRVKPDFPFVTTNLDSSQVMEYIVPAPEFDEEEYRENWLNEQQNRILSAESDPENAHISHHFIGNEHAQKCLFVVASGQYILKRKELLASVGLTPICITSGRLEATYSCLFNEEFVQDNRYLVQISEEGTILFTLTSGMVADLDVIKHSSGSVDEVVEEVATHLITSGQFAEVPSARVQLFVVLEQEERIHSATYEIGGHSFEVIPISPLNSIKGKGDKPGSAAADATCAGMAVKQLYPALDAINLLTDEERGATAEQIEKKDALNAGLLMGGTVVLVWLLIMVVQFYYQSKLDVASEQVMLLNDKITAVSTADSQMTYWTSRVEEARKLVSERTRFASLLEKIGRSLPHSIWFTGMDVTNSNQQSQVKLRGLSRSETKVTTLMERLEHIQSLSHVRLVLSERVKAQDIYKAQGYPNVSLIRFEIHFNAQE